MSKPRVLVAGRVHADGMALLEGNDSIELTVCADDSHELAQHLPHTDALVIRIARMTEVMLASAPTLRVVSRHGVGCDNVPVDSLTARGVPVMITGIANSAAVAEHALYLMLAVARAALLADGIARQVQWQRRNTLITYELAGRRLLVLGLGRIGRQLAVKAGALGMQVSAYDPFVAASACAELGVIHVLDLQVALADADVLSLHLPSTGKALIGAQELQLLPAGAILINVARGDLVDEDALVAALKSGRLFGVGLDVFATEPPAPDHPLFAFDNVVLTPHVAALTAETKRRMGIVSVQNALNVLAGKVDPAMVFNPGWDQQDS